MECVFLKKQMTFLVSIFIMLLISLFGCSQKTNDTTNSKVPDSLTITQISSENLSPWKITLNPHMEDNRWLCDIQIENKSSSTLSDVSGKIGEATITEGGLIQPNSEAFGFTKIPISKNKKFNLSLVWYENGKEFKGKAIYKAK